MSIVGETTLQIFLVVQQYIARIDAIRQRSKNFRENSRYQFKNAPELNEINFPALQNKSSPWQGQSSSHQTFAPSHQVGPSKQSQGNLLSPSECMSVLNT